MEPWRWLAQHLAHDVPAATQVVGLDRGPDRGSEHHALVDPTWAGRQTLLALGLPMGPESLDARPRERNRPPRLSGLRRLEPELALHTLERVGDLEELLVEIDVVPSQTEQLAPTQPEIDGEHV